MIIDIKDLNKNHFDYCIIGSGPAGMTVATELAKKNASVLIVEAGDLNYNEISQQVYDGKVIGDKYFKLSEARIRQLGGSSNHWGGWCRHLDEIDFKDWPIKKSDLDIYYERALKILELPKIPKDKILDEKNGIKEIAFKWSYPPVNFGIKYFENIKKSKNLHLSIKTNLLNLNSKNKKIESIDVVNYNNYKTKVKAKIFILATGGIENSRILLHSNDISKEKIIKSNKTLGKYWMEHHVFTLGDILANKEFNDISFFSLTAKKQSELKILNCGLRLLNNTQYGFRKTVTDLLCTAPKISEFLLSNLTCGKTLRAAWEQEPLESNCIKLSKTEKDIFGTPKVELYWKKSTYDLQTVRETAILFGKYLIDSDIGRLKLHDWVYGADSYPENDEIAGYHHMGGTRMGTSKENSIVDRNCKVWEQENLYIAGSSVFPTGGHANPTFTIVQLAIRLADHLKPTIQS